MQARGETTQREPVGATPVVAVFCCGMFAFINMYCTQPLLPLFRQLFQATEMHVGLTVSASTIGVAISAALLAVFGEKFNRKRIIVLSMVLLGCCTLLTSTATGLNQLAMWRFFQGLLTPGVFILTIAYITEEWPPLRVPRVMSAYVAGTVFGGFLGRFFGGEIAALFNWHIVFLSLGTLGLCGAALTARLLPPATHRHAAGDADFAPLRKNLRNPRLLATFAIGFCMLFTLVSVFSYVTFYLAAAPFNLNTAELSRLFAVYLIGLLATLAAGTVLARVGLRTGILAAIGLCLCGLAITLLHSLTVIAVGLALVSSGVFIAQTCANSFLRDAAPRGARVSAAGLYICSYYIGGTVGGLLPGLAWRHAGWPGCVVLIGSFLLLAGTLARFGWPAHTRPSDAIPLEG